jgi:hypothetical protein
MRDPVCTFVVVLVGCFVFAGCEAAYLIGGMAQNFEYQKEIEVLAEYDLVRQDRCRRRRCGHGDTV